MQQHGLFKRLPSSLFFPLAAPGSAFYSEVLLTLFTETNRHPEPLSRELCVMLIEEILEDMDAFSLTNDLNEEGFTEENRSLRRASAVLRYLLRCQWLREEIQRDFTVVYTLPDHAFRLLAVLYDIAQDTKAPLQGLICAIHDLLRAAVQNGNVQTRIPQAYRETLRLQNGLKELQHNIGVHIETVLQQATPKDILEQTFRSYLQEVTRRSYHELRTTDHVSRFRPGINEALSALLTRDVPHPENTEEGQAEHYEITHLTEQLQDIQAYFDTMDSQMQAIDIRHRQFFDVAIRSIESKLQASTTTSGHLRTILTYLLEAQNTATSLEETLRESNLDALVELYGLLLVESKSLMSPRRPRELFSPEADEYATLSDEDITAAREKTLERLRHAISREQVRLFAQKLLSDCEERLAESIPLSGPEQLPLLIYLKAYGDGSLGYVVEEIPDAARISMNDIAFQNFLIRRVQHALSE